jgi:hypothetical protein
MEHFVLPVSNSHGYFVSREAAVWPKHRVQNPIQNPSLHIESARQQGQH